MVVDIHVDVVSMLFQRTRQRRREWDLLDDPFPALWCQLVVIVARSIVIAMIDSRVSIPFSDGRTVVESTAPHL